MALKHYTGYEWLLIDAASQFGFDKLTFEDRIAWSTKNIDILEAFIDDAETKPLYIKAVMAIRKAQQRIPTGHLVGVDASCSGIQIMSVLTGCKTGALATGLIDPDVRADAYTACTKVMNDILGGQLDIPRADAKASLMTSFYGSKQQPKLIFGEDTPELNAFYSAAQAIAPGAWELLQDLLGSWQPYTLLHAWKLPDGYDARVKVMKKIEARIEVDELDHATFTYQFYENEGSKKGLSLAANVTHSFDAYVLRSMHRRCNYDHTVISKAVLILQLEMMERAAGSYRSPSMTSERFAYYVAQYERSGLADVVLVPFLDATNVQNLSDAHVEALASIVQGMLQYKPFELVTIHDEYRAHANNVNWVRYQYKEILAELAESTVLDDILSQIHGKSITFQRPVNSTLGAKIRESSYGLC